MAVDTSAVKDLAHPKLEALVEMMYLAASADGEFSDIEHEAFFGSVESLTDGRLARKDAEAIIERVKRELETDGRDARLAAVKARLVEPGARRVALSLAIQITAADGFIRTSERELILETAEALEIDRDEAADLVAKIAPP
jgi:tellurite resistance protein